MIKLLIVDDSALMRRQLMNLFQAEGDFEVRQARNGEEAVRENRDFQPDVVTLDINMPEMDGLTALSLIMAERPVAVVMVSSLTNEGALATFEALNLGAVDYIAKPGGTISLSIDRITEELVAKVRGAARSRPRGKASVTVTAARRMQEERRKVARTSSAVSAPRSAGDGLLVVGASTGGPRALEIVLSGLPSSFPWPVLVAQHMPAAFTRAFAERLNQCCSLQVVEANSAQPIEAGKIYIARGGADMVLANRAGKLTVLPMPENAQFPRYSGAVDRHGLRRIRCVCRDQKARRAHHCRIGRVGRGLRNACRAGCQGRSKFGFGGRKSGRAVINLGWPVRK